MTLHFARLASAALLGTACGIRFASRLVMAGVDLRPVAELMGHKTIQMTMRYTHLAPAHKLAAVERLAAGWQTDRPTDTKTDTSGFEQESGGVSKAS